MKLFDKIRVLKPKRNKFDLSHERKMTLNMGPLYPCYFEEVIPGDTFRVNSQVFLRFLALIAPVMHRVDVSVHYFFVPNRLVWDNWQDFITGGRDGLAAPVAPYFTLNNVNSAGASYLKAGSLLDYFGFPTLKNAGTYNTGYNNYQFNALPLRAYQLIYNEYYRDQNVEASVLSTNFTGDGNVTGADLLSLLQLRTRAWEKDYLTSALPWTQRGGAVTLPITGTVTVPTTGSSTGIWRQSGTGAVVPNGVLHGTTNLGTGTAGYGTSAGATTSPEYYDPNGSMTVTSSSLTINALRLSNQLQVWLERNARAGGRYIEQLAAHFGVISSDARLQRPEYLGGGKNPVVVSEVLQTTPSSGGSTPLAQMGGHALSIGNTNTFKRFFEEHGFVIGLISVLPKTAYQQFCDPVWNGRSTNTSYYFPEFAHLGEQAVTNGTAYSDWGDASAASTWNNTFGYQGRYNDYKYHMDEVCGQFKESLNYWHFGRTFTSQPSLNTSFIQASVRTDPFAVTTDVDHLVAQIYHKVDALRPMPYFSEPRL